MQTRDSLNARRTAATLVAMSILGWAAAQPALAQATPKRTDSVLSKSDREKKEMIRRGATDWADDENDPALVDPAPLEYPYAAPGTLHLNHWTDYTRTRMAPGSVQEERDARRDLMHRRMYERQNQMKSQMKSMNGSVNPAGYGSADTSGQSFHRTNSAYNDTTSGYQSNNRYATSSGSGYGEMPAGFQGQSRNGSMSGRAGMENWTPMASYGDSLYIIRGNTLLKLNSSDLSVMRQQELPAWSDSLNGSSDRVGASGFNSNSSARNGQNTLGDVSGSNAAGGNASNGSRNGDNGSSNNSGTPSGNTNPSGNNEANSGRTGSSGNNGSNSDQFGTSSGSNGSQSGTDASGRRSNRRSSGTAGSRANGAMMNDRMFTGMAAMAPVSISAGSDFVYVLRGDTLFQLRSTDLSLASRKQIPSMSGYGDNPSGLRGSSSGTNSNSSQSGQGNGASSNGNGSQNSNGNRGNNGGNNNSGSNGNSGGAGSSNNNGNDGSSGKQQ